MATQKDIKAFAETLFKLGVRDKKLDTFKEDFAEFSDLFKQDANLKKFMLSPRISRNDKKSLLDKLLKDKLSEDFLGFIYVLLAKQCQGVILKIHDHFQVLVDRHENVARGKAISYQKLSEKALNEIADVVSKRFGKKVILSPIVNEKILGGLILQVGDKRVDMSVKNNLEGMKSKIQNIYFGGAE